MSEASGELGPGVRVAVRAGLETLVGTVISRYENPSGARLVIELDDRGDGGDSTISVPAEDASPVTNESEVPPPGSWVGEAALVRALTDSIDQSDSSWVEEIIPSAMVGSTRYDLLVSGPNGATVVVEVKLAQHPVSVDLADRIWHQLMTYRTHDPSAKWLAVSNQHFSPAAMKFLNGHGVTTWTWRNNRDNEGFVRALKKMLTETA
ncbi:hypothetical protein GCM10009539_59260 [Cryptosporangium japonicum]|uniref:Uncharacterized protein n=2 Tax=Cryptosporangium japonicum TaxID=80872 RepID=A0ABN0UXS2_9ACTN